MMSTRLRWVTGAALLLLLAVNTEVSAAFKFLSEGMEAPKVEGKDILSGQKVSSEFKTDEGHGIVIVAFWATWSNRSLELLGDLSEYAREFDGDNLKVLAVNVEGQKIGDGITGRVREKVEELNLPFPVIIDEGLEIFSSFGVVAVPSTAILDERGVLRYGPAGYSYLIRDRIVDSVETYLGLREPTQVVEISTYEPKDEALRYYNLARQMNERGIAERAIAHLDHAEQVDPGFPSIATLRGQIHLAADEFELAAQAFEKATTLDEKSPLAWAGLGIVRAKQDMTAEAEVALRKALELDPAFTPALLVLAECRIAAEDYDAAEAALREVQELRGALPVVDYRFGEIASLRGNVDGALEYYQKALEALFPLHWDPRHD